MTPLKPREIQLIIHFITQISHSLCKYGLYRDIYWPYISYSLYKLQKVAILILPLWQVARVNDEKSIQMGLWAVCRAAPIAKLNQRYDKRIRYLGGKPLFECQMAPKVETKCIKQQGSSTKGANKIYVVLLWGF